MRRSCACLFLVLAACGARSPLDDRELAPGTGGVGTSRAAWCKLGDPPAALARPASRPASLAIGADHAFWWSPTDGTLWSAPLRGGRSTKLADGPDDGTFLARVIVDGTTAYWAGSAESVDWTGTHGGWVRALPSGAPTPTVLAEHLGDPQLLAAKDGAIVWLDARPAGDGASTHELVRGEAGGSLVTLVPAFRTSEPVPRGSAAFDGERLFVAVDHEIHVLTADAHTTIAPATTPAPIAVDDAAIYWIDCPEGTQTGNVMRLATDGASPTTLLRASFACESSGQPLLVKGGSLYAFSGGALVRIATADGKLDVLLAEAPALDGAGAWAWAPWDLAVDDSCLYAAYDQAIVRIPR
jgi:hypothetical protein